MAKTEVTNAQYATFLQATGHEPPGLWENGLPPDGKQDYPVVEAIPLLSVIERNKPQIAQITRVFVF
jgi:formylglycine-generating enzyme required for sulfatase activity